jgi:hypothetical protein
MNDDDWHLLWERAIVFGTCVLLLMMALGVLK